MEDKFIKRDKKGGSFSKENMLQEGINHYLLYITSSDEPKRLSAFNNIEGGLVGFIDRYLSLSDTKIQSGYTYYALDVVGSGAYAVYPNLFNEVHAKRGIGILIFLHCLYRLTIKDIEKMEAAGYYVLNYSELSKVARLEFSSYIKDRIGSLATILGKEKDYKR